MLLSRRLGEYMIATPGLFFPAPLKSPEQWGGSLGFNLFTQEAASNYPDWFFLNCTKEVRALC